MLRNKRSCVFLCSMIEYLMQKDQYVCVVVYGYSCLSSEGNQNRIFQCSVCVCVCVYIYMYTSISWYHIVKSWSLLHLAVYWCFDTRAQCLWWSIKLISMKKGADEVFPQRRQPLYVVSCILWNCRIILSSSKLRCYCYWVEIINLFNHKVNREPCILVLALLAGFLLRLASFSSIWWVGEANRVW